MIKVAAIRPGERMREIQGWRKELAYETQSKIDSWGLQVSSYLARHLSGPRFVADVQDQSGDDQSQRPNHCAP